MSRIFFSWITGVVMGASLLAAPVQADPKVTSEAAHKYRAAHEKEILQDFVALLSLPNDAASQADIAKNAVHIRKLLEARGIKTELLEAGGSPYIYGELNTPGATKTVLIYAHYDGQPVQVENWASPPWQPVLRTSADTNSKVIDIAGHQGAFNPEWRLFARSAGDDKAPVIGLTHALDALKANAIPRSINIKILLDGEEEKGSPTLAAVLEKYRGKLDADLLLFCDGPVHQSRHLALGFGARGTYGVHITTYGPSRPLHSGHYGNWAPNPAMMLVHLLASMRDDEGKILIDGYYDDVVPPSEAELAAIAAMPELDKQLKHELALGRSEGNGRRLEELIMWPAVNLRGFVAGGVNAQSRNAIVTSATASVGLRLVPKMTLEGVRERIIAHVKAQGFHIVTEEPTAEILRSHNRVAKLDWRGGGYPSHRTDMSDARVKPLIEIMRGLDAETVLQPTHGGSLPLYLFAEAIEDTPIIILPIANHDNNQHAENENLRLQNLWDAIAIYASVLAHYGEGQ